jgi:hypothetical protein
MRLPRVSIAGLMVFVALVALGFLALRFPSHLVLNVVFSAMLAVLAASVVLAVTRRGARRAFWVGFATFGGTYVVLGFGPWFSNVTNPMLVTTTVLDLVYPLIVPSPPPPAPPPAAGGGMMKMMGGVGGGYQASMGMMMGGMGGAGPPPPQAAPRTPWTYWNDLDPNLNLIGSHPVASSDRFRQVGHALFALVIAAIGGWLVRTAYETREEAPVPRGERPEQ